VSLSLVPNRTALFLLDFQVDVCAVGGKLMRDEPELVARFERVRTNASRVLSFGRSVAAVSGFHCVHVGRQIDYNQTDLRGAEQNRLEAYLAQCQAFAKDSEGVQFVEEVRPIEGEQVIWKHGLSAFAGTELAYWLARRGVDTVVLLGVTTHYAVLTTALAAIDHGLRTIVLDDCCTSRTLQRHKAALELLRPIVDCVSGDVFCEQLQQAHHKHHPQQPVTLPAAQQVSGTPSPKASSETGPHESPAQVSRPPLEELSFEDAKALANTLTERLAQHAPAVQDQELIDCIEMLGQSLAMRTNAEMAAYHIFCAAIPFAYYRQSLIVELFPFAMFGLLTMFYDRFEDQTAWLQRQMDQKEPFGGLPAEQLAWLQELLEEKSVLHQCFQTAAWWEYMYPDEDDAISGMLYIPDFLKAASEKKLLQTIDKAPWLQDLKRRVQHYGYKYDYRARAIDKSMSLGPLPDWAQTLSKDLFARGILPFVADQVIVNEYQPGQGISPHVDCVPCFADTIASISLGSSCIMDFKHASTKKSISKWLPPRSLLVLSGESRYDWTHAIASRKTDKAQGQTIERRRRVSLTFRKVILKP
jgi:alkylated DNA repair dioxygenase AlkB/nicotinamidase-related amidase